ncbi:MAG: tetratricopeptide repeat protein [Nitrospiraceae bacterium]|nr:tetratricopeptide repeat protein [Nitrospiraceae bacterium]
MANEDISKLKEKVDRDPNSRLFVPLADEYKKMGMLEEAIGTLLIGLDAQPNYMSARVALGKIYLEKNMMHEAREEFEKVILAIPDNLYAHKKLAETYRDLKQNRKAVEEYEKVLKLNPNDEDALPNIERLKNLSDEPEPEEKEEQIPQIVNTPPKPVFVQTHEEEEDSRELLPAEHTRYSMNEGDFEEFKKTFTEAKTEDADSLADITGNSLSLRDMGNIDGADKGTQNYLDVMEDTAESLTATIFEASKKAENSKDHIVVAASEKREKPVFDIKKIKIKEAESYIGKGDYLKAADVYNSILSEDPNNKFILQKLEELKMLLNMAQKKHEVSINKMETLAQGLRKRKDEFFRSS